MIVYLIGALTLGFLAVLLFGLATGRIAWRQQGCCAPPADRDLRLNPHPTRISEPLKRSIRPGVAQAERSTSD